jgi:predicted  nucleic acid-binding Zn-ribbon protein
MLSGKRLTPVETATKRLIENLEDWMLDLKDELENLEDIIEDLKRLHHVE